MNQTSDEKSDIIIIGGGAAGLFAAGFALRRGFTVTVIEKNERPVRKVLITGKGRCNLTNDCDVDTLISSVTCNNRFLYGAFHRFSSRDTIDFFENELSVPLKTERGNRVFPVSDKAMEIADALQRFAAAARIIQGQAAEILTENDAVTGVKLADGRVFRERQILLATGGCSYPRTGSTGDGYRLAARLGHTITKPAPSLVPVVAGESYCAEMMGLSLRNVTLSVEETSSGKTVFSELGEMLFTHFGVSGPLVLSASAHMRPMEPGRFRLHIDLKPGLSPQKLDERLKRDFDENLNREFKNSLGALLPRKLIPVIIRLSGIPADSKLNQLTREQRQSFGRLIKDFPVTAKGFRPIEEAIVTSGGITVGEVSPKTMESKLVRGLFFAGEVLDVDAYTGGFNLQIAFSTAYTAAQAFDPCGG